MTRRIQLREYTALAVIGLTFVLGADAKETEIARSVVFISDLHMGLGRDENDAWYRTEDFRWPKALKGFLNHTAKEGKDSVDLVIVGDFLELWQPPAHIKCKGPNADYGCSVDEIKEIVRAVIAGHQDDFKALASFGKQGDNCVHVIPGNHDASLVIDDVWALVADALDADNSCVNRVATGRWTSADGKIVAEHGHQMGWDPNRYTKWPAVTRKFNGEAYLRRPWGEQFVQKIFNATEADSPLIDNLSPNSAGAKYRMKDRGVAASTGDIARFLKFNLLETSLSQKISILGEQEESAEEPPRWDIGRARALGWQLFSGALAADDVLAESFGDLNSNPELKSVLEQMAKDVDLLPDDEVLALCDQMAMRKRDPKCQTPAPNTLGYAISKLLSSRERTVGPYVERLWKSNTELRVFVYGHTHSFEREWTRNISSRVSVRILNDGAFLRLIDDTKFRAKATAMNQTPGKMLRTLSISELPACYTYVTVSEVENEGLISDLKAWYMPEESAGEPIDVCDVRCADVGHGCD